MSTLFSQIMSKINQIHISEHAYLQSMIGIDDMPKSLYSIGAIPATRQPTVAIVGSRKPTSYGREVTHDIAYKLAKRGVVIVSGMALGIDGIAHRAALEAGGVTIAVLANGLHRMYPSTNRQLAADIVASGGAILSEYEAGIEPMQYRFLERNRLVSAMADVVVVTEAASRSGTLNTAAHALVQGKELCAVPGNITSAMSAGCNSLLKQGATPLISVEDIFELLNIDTKSSQLPLAIGSTPTEQQIIDALVAGLRDGGEIFNSIEDITSTDFNLALTSLEIQGVIKPLGNNKWQLSS